jgi:hypothetical protein
MYATERDELWLDDPRAGECRARRRGEGHQLAVCARLLDREQRLALLLLVLLAQALLQLSVLLVEARLPRAVEKARDDSDDT